jgi:multiple sugar transport system substrate-binding protein
MALYYNSQLFAKYHLTPPSTWAQFASEAAKLHKENPHVSFSNFGATDVQWWMSLMAQNGAWPFHWNGSSRVTIDLTGPRQVAFADYWQGMLSKHELGLFQDWAAPMYHAMASGLLASIVSPAWGPAVVLSSLSHPVPVWRAANLPQWKAGGQQFVDDGGSTYAVLAQSKHPKQAASFLFWMNATMAGWKILSGGGLFPTWKPLLESPGLQTETLPLSGNSHPEAVFAHAALHISAISWPPFTTEMLTEGTSILGKVQNGTESFPAALKVYQNTVVGYAKSEGFQVSS